MRKFGKNWEKLEKKGGKAREKEAEVKQKLGKHKKIGGKWESKGKVGIALEKNGKACMEKHGKRWENKENMEKFGKTLEKVEEVEKRWEEVATLMILFYDQTLRLGTGWPGSPWGAARGLLVLLNVLWLHTEWMFSCMETNSNVLTCSFAPPAKLSSCLHMLILTGKTLTIYTVLFLYCTKVQ